MARCRSSNNAVLRVSSSSRWRFPRLGILLTCTHPFRGGKHASQHFQTHPSQMHTPVSWREACVSAFPDPSELEGESALVPGPHHGPEEGSGGHIPESTPRPRMCLVLCLSGPGVSEWGQLHLDHDD